MKSSDAPNFNGARWIWVSGEAIPVNALVEFRMRMTLEKHATSQIRILICADNRYHLWINGRWCAYGPVRSHPCFYRFDVLDITDYLEKGDNELLVKVHHWGEGTFQSYVQRAGLLVELQAEDGRSLLVSDEKWEGRTVGYWRRNTPRIACQLGFEEQIDLCKSSPPWQHAIVIGPIGYAPWGDLRPMDIPPLQEQSWIPVFVSSNGHSETGWHQKLFSLRASSYLLPGNKMANGEWVEGCFTTFFTLHQDAAVTIRRCAMYGGPVKLYLDGDLIPLEQDVFDFSAQVNLTAGEHLLVLDWEGLAYDRDVSVLLEAREPIQANHWSENKTLWLFFSSRRSDIRSATHVHYVMAMKDQAIAVAPEHTPEEDVYLEMTHRRIKQVTREIFPPQQAVVLLPSEESCWQRLVYDFGKQGFGFVEIELEAPGGTYLQGAGIEGLNEGQLQFTELANNTFSYFSKTHHQSFRSHVPRGFRYLVLDVFVRDQPVKIKSVYFNQYTYRWQPQGSFYSSNALLNQIYHLSCQTLRVCSADTFIDAPYEQALWVGDFASMTLKTHFYVQGEAALPERCLRLAAESLKRLPMVNSQVPSSWENRIIPNWSFLWAIGVKDHVLYSGNREFGQEMLASLRTQADFVLKKRNDANLFEWHENTWHFLDWDHPGAGEQNANQQLVYCHENCLAIASFKACVQIAEWCNEMEQANWFRGLALSFEQATFKTFWDPKEKAFRETLDAEGICKPIFSASNQICALMADFPGMDQRSLVQRILKPPVHWRAAGTPWMWALGARHAMEAGLETMVMEGILKEWGTMIGAGASAAWEMFAGNHRPGLSTRSWAHGWSAGPAWLLPAYVLGLRPLSPGWETFTFRPLLFGLKYAKGSIPTPYGEIRVSCGLTEEGNPANKIVAPPECNLLD